MLRAAASGASRVCALARPSLAGALAGARAASARSGAPAAAAGSAASAVYPGGRTLPFTSVLDSHAPSTDGGMPVFRLVDEGGAVRAGAAEPAVSRADAVAAYGLMLRLQTMDGIFYDSQRQGRISFYMTNWGEEGIQFGSAAAWRPDDEVFAQYREAGVLMARGFSLQQFADQLFSNVDDLGKGRQMPVHYGSAALHFQTISSPLATQLPQAAGAAYAAKLEGRGRVVVCYFGEGAASEGDFAPALNMAAVHEAPVVFVCRNNGYAISTPVTEQYRGDGIAGRGIAYGMHTMRVDGGDYFAVREACAEARRIAVGGDGTGKTKPVLVECMAYREGHHSTSDDSTRYRSAEEIGEARARGNPVRRLRAFLERRGWWDADAEAAAVAAERAAVLAALAAAEAKDKPPAAELFADVYGDAALPAHLAEQKAALDAHVARHPGAYKAGGH